MDVWRKLISDLNLFACYDWASGRVYVTVQHGANEIPNQRTATLELEPFHSLRTPKPPSIQQPLIPNPSTGFIKTWTWGKVEKWTELSLSFRWTWPGQSALGETGENMKSSLVFKHNAAFVTHVWALNTLTDNDPTIVWTPCRARDQQSSLNNVKPAIYNQEILLATN